MGDRTRVRRLADKQQADRGALDAVLDEAVVAHVGIVDPGGYPVVIPMACARDGDRLLLHGSTGSRLTAVLSAGGSACVTVTLLDGLVYARSAFESSMHYRSAVVFGVLSRVPAAEVTAALRVLTEHLLPGRWDELRAPHRRELAATAVLALPLVEWSLKVGDTPPEDPADDLDAPVWAGVLPLRTVAGEPVDAPDLRGGHRPPAHVLERYC